ncbi:hypothetical protein GC089_03590 [Cellulomonas sp. JZ18]|nr:hypothetical protein GC089_03590 [Cellulomonas sp. JZ18]
MVGAGPAGDLDNTAPPTLALLALTVAWTGGVLLLRAPGERAAARPRVWEAVVGANAVVLTVFLWHTVPVVLAGLALVGTGLFPEADVGSGHWFALRVPWVLVLAVLLVALVAAAGRFELRASPPPAREPSGVVVGAGVAACVVGLAGVGVGGVDGLAPAVAGVPVTELALVAVGGVLLSRAGRGRRRGRPREGHPPAPGVLGERPHSPADVLVRPREDALETDEPDTAGGGAPGPGGST